MFTTDVQRARSWYSGKSKYWTCQCMKTIRQKKTKKGMQSTQSNKKESTAILKTLYQRRVRTNTSTTNQCKGSYHMAIKTESLHPSWSTLYPCQLPLAWHRKDRKQKEKAPNRPHVHFFFAKSGGEPTYTKMLEKSVNDENLTHSPKKERKRQE